MTTPYQDAPYEAVIVNDDGTMIPELKCQKVETPEGLVIACLPIRYVFENGEYIQVRPTIQDLPSSPSQVL